MFVAILTKNEWYSASYCLMKLANGTQKIVNAQQFNYFPFHSPLRSSVVYDISRKAE